MRFQGLVVTCLLCGFFVVSSLGSLVDSSTIFTNRTRTVAEGFKPKGTLMTSSDIEYMKYTLTPLPTQRYWESIRV